MPDYTNGNIPASLLITFNSGWDDLGYWEHQWPAHTLALHNALVARAAARRAAAGLPPLPLRLQSGWTAYRPLEWQKTYRAILGVGAATPGKSSHGGTFEGSQTMAGDYAWQSVYRDCGGRDAFFEDCRAVGMRPGMISAARGYPDEDWHVIDPDPWAPVPAGLSVTEFTTTESEEDDDMKFMDEINTIIWPNGVPCAYPADTFTVIKQYVNYPTHPVWSGGKETFEREAWAAVKAVVGLTATVVAGALDAESDRDVAQIVAGVLAGIPAASVPATDPVALSKELAQAVADEQDRRARERLAK